MTTGSKTPSAHAAGSSQGAAIASRDEAPATPQVAIAAAPSDARKLCDMYQQLAEAMGYHSGEGGMEFSPEEWASALLRDATAFRAITQPTTVQQAPALDLPEDLSKRVMHEIGHAINMAGPNEPERWARAAWRVIRRHLIDRAALKTAQTTALNGGNGEGES